MNVTFECINIDSDKIVMVITTSPTSTKTLILNKTKWQELAESIFVYLGTPINEMMNGHRRYEKIKSLSSSQYELFCRKKFYAGIDFDELIDAWDKNTEGK